jgi:hypothetical protein
MRPTRPRLHAALRWGGTPILVVLIFCWLASPYWWFTWRFVPRVSVGFADGAFCCEVVDTEVTVLYSKSLVPGLSGAKRGDWPADNYWPFTRQSWSRPRMIWWIDHEERVSGWIRSILVPLWMPVVLLAIPTGRAWQTYFKHRRASTACPTCGYDRSGLPGGSAALCPECGKPAG